MKHCEEPPPCPQLSPFASVLRVQFGAPQYKKGVKMQSRATKLVKGLEGMPGEERLGTLETRRPRGDLLALCSSPMRASAEAGAALLSPVVDNRMCRMAQSCTRFRLDVRKKSLTVRGQTPGQAPRTALGARCLAAFGGRLHNALSNEP